MAASFLRCTSSSGREGRLREAAINHLLQKKMTVSVSLMHIRFYCSPELIEGKPEHLRCQPQSKSSCISANSEGILLSRRLSVITGGASLITSLSCSVAPLPIKAEEDQKKPGDKKNDDDGGVLGAIKSILDPNEKTKTGKLLPKTYLKDAREVVKTLRESLQEDTKDVSKFRRTADAAKESIRQYLSSWKGQPAVVAEESYAAIEKAIRSLANFYSKAGPFATMTEDVKASILNDLKTAEDFL
ncbi:photosystem II D1 precursor processing protein PSB27-H2, chloroplastic isoform X1 [Canna indica]|uniref:Photosystem II D1 processing protein PSB27-H2, chloroplastic isoform X1 n=1 Tax=Canna indica TaxID=4628 RepID=A0AAQ3JKN2_9LILI|nr:photosystem II D1 precursor processing protein PSB27-H2, chloroplastic isoform X1 [Canna indica]